MNPCAVTQDLAEYEARVDMEDMAEKAWAERREWWIGVLMDGETVYLGHTPFLGKEDLLTQMCDDSGAIGDQAPGQNPLMDALGICNRDKMAGGKALKLAMRVAAERLIDANEAPLRRQFEQAEEAA